MPGEKCSPRVLCILGWIAVGIFILVLVSGAPSLDTPAGICATVSLFVLTSIAGTCFVWSLCASFRAQRRNTDVVFSVL